MSTTFTKATKEVERMAKGLIALYHEELKKMEVTIDFLFAYNPEGTALKLHGVACLGIAKIINLKDRVKGMADGEITLDGTAWEQMTEAQQKALLDHEINHFEIKRDNEGKPVTDDHGRPELKTRRHDRDFGWFDVIAQRHGSASFEVKQVRDLYLETRQTYFGFLSETPLAVAA